jgi:hypothetical protein
MAFMLKWPVHGLYEARTGKRRKALETNWPPALAPATTLSESFP